MRERTKEINRERGWTNREQKKKIHKIKIPVQEQ
jgi:hypothetical protein